jgi:hypothetical protein
MLMSLCCVVPLACAAQDKKDTKLPRIAISDPAKLAADAQFAVQGEYTGVLPDGKPFGVQVVAHGDGKYFARVCKGGLPGDGWNGEADDTEIAITTVDGKVIVKAHKGIEGEITGGEIRVKHGEQSITAKRVERTVATLGTKPPAGAVVLYDQPGDIENWEKCKVEEVSDGKFLGVGGRTKKKFQSFTLHLEFRLPYMPNSTGQQRGNSGVYLQDRYEVQVLDSFGLKGVDNECGGIYKESAPKVNMCLPPMVWQAYDIDFTAATFEDGKKVKPATVTVKQNGVVIHDKLELKSNTPGGAITKEVPEPGSLFLQNHGDPVVYRNVWIVER